MNTIVYLVTTGDGSDGDEWCLVGIYTTRDKAEAAAKLVNRANEIEEWAVDPE